MRESLLQEGAISFGVNSEQIENFESAKYIYDNKPRYIDPVTGNIRGVDSEDYPIPDKRVSDTPGAGSIRM